MSEFKSQRELFFHIWQTRPHYCTNCKKYLGEEAKAHYFAHIISKSLRKDLMLLEENIRILCIGCHHLMDFDTDENFKKKTR